LTLGGNDSVLPLSEGPPAMLDALRRDVPLTSSQPGPAAQWARARGIADFAFVPGVAQGNLVCVLCVHNGQQPYEFHASALRFLKALAGHAALVLRNRQLIAELRQNNAELAAANRKLKELDRLKSQFLSMATHELRTPLSVILGYNSMLAESLHDRLTAEEAEALEESAGACKRLIRLVNSMLDVTQIESGKIRMSFAPTDARQVVLAVERLLRHEAELRDIKLHVQVPSRIPRVLLDPERIQQLLINLVDNALKFTPPGGQVGITLRQVHQSGNCAALEFIVRDTGIGIPQDKQDLIFEEFAQLSPATRQPATSNKAAEKGFGLGLAICRRLVAAHEGTLEVSSSPGAGSTFKATIPIRQAQAAADHSLSA
jgi:signal transduction histidine kinase